MAVPEQTPYKEYIANGITTSFPLTFDCDNQEHLIVLIDDVEQSAEMWLLAASTVAFSTAPLNGSKITIQRNTPLKRDTNFQSYDNSFRPPAVDKDFDWIWRKLQEFGVKYWLNDTDIKNLGVYVNSLNDETRDDFFSKLGNLEQNTNAMLEEAIKNGAVSSLAVTTVRSVSELSEITKWDGRTVRTKAYNPIIYGEANPTVRGGATYVYNSSRSAENDGGSIINGWVLIRDGAITPYHFGSKGDRFTNDTTGLKNFFTYIATHLVDTADWSGDFITKEDIIADTGSTANWKDKPTYVNNILGHLTIRSDYASDDFMLSLLNFNDTHFNGKLSLIGKGISFYGSRTNGHGLYLRNCKKFNFAQIETWYMKGRGFVPSGTSTEGVIGALDQWYCGASAGAASVNNLTLTTPTYENVGASGVNTQRCKVTVGVGTIPTVMQVNDFILFFNSNSKHSEAKQVKSIDRATNSFEVYPWVYDTDKAYTPCYVIGGGLYSEGGDTSGITILKHSTISCGVGNNSQSLYPVKVLNHISQFNGIAAAPGANGSEGGCIASSYYEGNGLNDLEPYPSSGVYIGSMAPEAEKWKRSHLQAGILDGVVYKRGNAVSGRVHQASGRLPIAAGNQLANGVAQSRPVISTNRPTVANFTAIQTNGSTANGGIVKLSYDDIMNREYGIDSLQIFIHGTTASGGVVGSVTIQPNEPKHTVNGLTEIVLTITEPTLLLCRWIANDWKVFAFTAYNKPQVSKKASVTYNPPSLVAGERTPIQTMTLTGAALGDKVVFSFDKDLQGVSLDGNISAQNTVSYYFENRTGATVDLASGTVFAKII